MDTNLIYEGSETRRKFIDLIISQYDKIYLQNLIQYNKVLSQRNAYLKSIQQGAKFDELSLQIWDEQLVVLGEKIHAQRTGFIEEFQKEFNVIYKTLSGGNEVCELTYKSQLLEDSFSRFVKIKPRKRTLHRIHN